MGKPKNIILFGKVVEVRDTAGCDECDWWVCPRVQDGEKKPLESAIEDFCTQCGHAVWYDPRPNITKPKKICVDCVLEKSKPKPK